MSLRRRRALLPTTSSLELSSPSPSHSSHHDLIGRERLFNLVECLNLDCPWTKSITAKDMIKWLQSEVVELQDEMDLLCNQNDNNESQAKQALVSELGDILFDCLMLEALIRR